jgi:radical SAM-linked protein
VNSIRIRFIRGDEVKFIGHLDMMKVFERAIRRSGLPIAYSQGFNPHPCIVFGLPLSVGTTSCGEYADFELSREIGADKFMDTLNRSLPDGIKITAAAEKNVKTNIMASIAQADYSIDIFLNETVTLQEAEKRFSSMMDTEQINVMKEGKNGAKEIDIKPLIIGARIETIEKVPAGYENFEAAFTVKCTFKAGSAANLRPELFVSALAQYGGLAAAASRFHRDALYVEKNGAIVDPMDSSVLNDA